MNKKIKEEFENRFGQLDTAGFITFSGDEAELRNSGFFISDKSKEIWEWIETNIEKEKKEFWTDICLYIAKNKLMKQEDYVRFVRNFKENV